MTWVPVRNYFAVRATDPLSVVLLVGDDLADVEERRRILEKLTGGMELAIVWGLDGAPVTREQARKMLTPTTEEVEVDALVEVEVEVEVEVLCHVVPLSKLD